MVIFHISGHENILGTHRNTLEFTKDKDLTRKGDCIVGVSADFCKDSLKELAKKYSLVRITIRIAGQNDSFTAITNKEYDDSKELVIRRSSFKSKRTFAINSEKTAYTLKRDIINMLKDKKANASVSIEGIK